MRGFARRPAMRSASGLVILLGRLPGFMRSGAGMPFRPDVEWPSRLFAARTEEDPAAGAEPGFIPDHADRDTVDIRNLGTAQAKRVTATGLLLLGSVGAGRHRPHQKRQRTRQRPGEQQTELDMAGSNGRHEYPPKESLKPNTRIVGEGRGAGKQAIVILRHGTSADQDSLAPPRDRRAVFAPGHEPIFGRLVRATAAIASIKPCAISNDGYSPFMLAALTIGHHFSISAF
jgi:hypothetical protein